jgi:eukaryotic-like serine/threonine-protein kinase
LMVTPRPGNGNEQEYPDGSTVHRPISRRSSAKSPADHGSTAPVAPHDESLQFELSGGQTPAPVATFPGSSPDSSDGSVDRAETVIRRSDGGSSIRSPGPKAPATPAEVAGVLLGSRLSHFYLEELIGGGGMGAVFRARDERLDRTVAIKVIPFIGDDPDMQRRFRNEAQSAARLDHPNIARVYDVGMFEGWRYIVFEHIEGTNIRDLVAQHGVLSIDDAVFYTRQIAEALHHASGRGVVHRDVKPSNILVNTEGNTKLVDMGLARSDQLDMSGDMTASGVTLGTFDYISPEQARDPRDADVRSDIYSLGCTLYFMLTGSPPYPGGTMLQKLLNHGNAPPPDPAGLRPGVSADLTAIIHKMLAKSPDARYQLASDLVSDLRALAVREGLVRAQAQGTVTFNREDTVSGRFATHLPWLAAAGLLLIGAVVLQIIASLRTTTFTLDIPASAVTMRPLDQAERDRGITFPLEPGGNIEALVPTDRPISRKPGGETEREPRAIGGNPTDRTERPSPGDGAANRAAEQRPVDSAGPTAATVDPSATDPSNAPADPTTARSDLASLPPKYSELAMAREPRVAEAPAAGGQTVSKFEKIIIGGPSATLSTDTLRADSLVDAMRLAEENEVNVIEIAEPMIQSPPIRIVRDGMTIRSAVGSTEIRLLDDTSAARRSVMVDIASNRVDFQNLHFRWNVRSASIDGGTLFAITDNRLVRLSDCTITIENLTEREDVFGFEIGSLSPRGGLGNLLQSPSALRLTPDMAGALRDTDPLRGSGRSPVTERLPIPPLVAIEMTNVAARGEMTLFNVIGVVQLQLRWDNGFLATSRRMLDVAGANTPQSVAGNPIQLSLSRMTAWTGQGFIRTRLGPSGVYPLMIDRDSRKVVFKSPPAAPHIEFVGLAPDSEPPERLVNLRGEDNAYDYDPDEDWPLLMLNSGTGQRQVFWMSQMIGTSRPIWIPERSPRWVVRWTSPIDESILPSRMVASQFYQDGTVVSGFDRAALPDFPPPTRGQPDRGPSDNPVSNAP